MDGLSETNLLDEADGEWLGRTVGIESRKDESSVVICCLYFAVSLYHDLSLAANYDFWEMSSFGTALQYACK